MLYVRYGAAVSHIQIRETPEGMDYIALPATGEAESSVGSEAVFFTDMGMFALSFVALFCVFK